MSPPLPPRFSQFSDPVGDVIWAAVKALSPGEQQALYTRLRDHLGDEFHSTNGKSPRVHRAVDALRRAAELLGHSPSVNEYRGLRESHPAERFPADSSIRGALGSGAWNECLRLARLESVVDGDVTTANCGSFFTAAECIAALRACASEVGTVPTAALYRSWAGRADVRRRPGRRPLALHPIVRFFGSFTKGLAAAGLITGGMSAAVTANGSVRMETWKLSDEQIAAGLREVHQRLGHVPRSTEYIHERELIIAESRAAGTPRAIPSAFTLMGRYGSWNSALVEHGFEPFDGRYNLKPFEPRSYDRRLVAFSEKEMLAAIREAGTATGKGQLVTLQDYILWRKIEMENSTRESGIARRLPSPKTLRTHIGSWTRARQLAFAPGA